MSDEEFVADYFEDVRDPNDPRQALTPGLTEWPAFGKQMPMPAVKAMAPYQSEHLSALGFRYHPELAVKWKIRDPATGFAKFVNADELEELKQAGDGDVSEGAARGAMEELFSSMAPNLSEEFENLSDVEKAAKAAELAPLVEESMKNILNIRKQLGLDE